MSKQLVKERTYPDRCFSQCGSTKDVLEVAKILYEKYGDVPLDFDESGYNDVCTVLTIERVETDEEYTHRSLQEAKAKKKIEDKELRELDRLKKKYGE